MNNLTTNRIRISGGSAIFLVAMLMVTLMTAPAAFAAGPATVNLGSAVNFAALAKTGISTTGTTAIVGDIGLSPAAATYITGFPLSAPPTTYTTSTLVTGKVYAADYDPPTPTYLTTAILDMQTAYTDAAGRTLPDFTELGAGNISGMTLAPGLYKWGTGLLIGNTGVTLSGGADDVWIFQIAGTLIVNSDAIVTLSGGAQAKNIFWQVTGQATLGSMSQFKGNILGQTAVVMNTGASLDGRALAQTAVTLEANTVTKPAADITPGAATKLVFGVQPSTTASGGTITPAVTVRILDANNNLVTGDVRNVTLAIAANPGSGTLSGTTTVAASGGVATFSNLSINTTGTGYTLSAASFPVLTGATSSAFNINSGVLHHFTINAIGTPQIAGSAFSVTIKAQDANNNTVTSFSGTVGFTTNAGTITPVTSNDFTTGQLTQNVTVTQAGTGKTITVTKSGGTETGASNTIIINAGQATKVLVETAADGSGTGVPVLNIVSGSTIAFYAVARDASNNFVGNVAADSWAFINVTGGIVAGDLVQSGDKKSAVFTGNATGTAEVKATSGTLAATNSGTITVTLGAATKLAFGVQPGNTVPDGTITPSVTVRILDANNNLVTSDTRNVTLTIAVNPGSGTLSGTTTVAASGGVATFSSISINATGTGYTLSAASYPVLTGATSSAFNINSGVLHHFAIDAIGTPQTAGSAFSVTVTAQDANNNTVTSFTGTVGFTTNAGTITPVTSNDFTNGQLTQVVTVTQMGTDKAITVTASGGSETGTSNTLTVNAGQATKVLVETAADGSGTGVPALNIASGSSITFYAVARDASNNFVGNVAADSWVFVNVTGGIVAGDLVQSGDKKSAVFTGNAIGTAETKATAGTLAATNSGTITVMLGAAAKFIITGISAQVSGTTQDLTITAKDNGGNTDTSYTGDKSLIFSGANPSADPVKNPTVTDKAGVPVEFGSATTITFVNGIATVSTGKNGMMTVYKEETANIVATQGTITATGSDRLTVSVEGVVSVKAGSMPKEFSLSQNFPNPFNPSTTIQYSLVTSGMVSLKVYNMVGQEVVTLVNGHQEAGNHTLTFNAKEGIAGLSNGVYFYRLDAGSFVSIKKFVFMK